MNNLMKRSSKLNNKRGFTLVELIVVIVIIGILAAVLVPKLGGFTDRAQSTEALVAAKQVATAFDSWEAENGTWADTTPAARNAYVAKMSGVSSTVPTSTTTGNASGFALEDDGGFKVTAKHGADLFTASRATGADPVKLD